MDDRFVTLGLKIAYYRKLRGKTQEQLAKRVGISRTHLSNIEAAGAETRVSLDVIFKISDVLEIPTSYLFQL